MLLVLNLLALRSVFYRTHRLDERTRSLDDKAEVLCDLMKSVADASLAERDRMLGTLEHSNRVLDILAGIDDAKPAPVLKLVTGDKHDHTEK